MVYVNEAADARAANDRRDYEAALTHTRAGFIRYLQTPGSPDRTIPTFLLKQTYGLIAAAYGAQDVLDLMEASALRIFALEPQLSRLRWRPLDDVEKWREDSETMRWIEERAATSAITLQSLELAAVPDDRKRINTCATWLDKIGKIQLPKSQVPPVVGSSMEGTPPPSNVPTLEGYFPDLSALDRTQRAFLRGFRERFLAGESPQIDGQVGYVFLVLYELIRQGDAESGRLAAALQSARSAYAADSLSLETYTTNWQADLKYLAQDFKGGWRLSKSGVLPLDVYVNLAEEVDDIRVTSKMARSWVTKRQRVTQTLSLREAEVEAALQEVLDSAQEQLGTSLVLDLWKRLESRRKLPRGLEEMLPEFGEFLTAEDLRNWTEPWNRGLYDSPRRAFEGVIGSTRSVLWPRPWGATYWFALILRARLGKAYRDAENIVRRSSDLPQVGEGWVSEVALLHLLKAAFPDRNIVHQARPTWLTPQSLDIYFPEEKVAVEYQGEQHSKPVARFGGPTAFEHQLQRDEKKRKLCVRNNVRLVEVHPNYDAGAVVADLSSLFGE